MFSALGDAEVNVIVDAVEEAILPAGELIITQGDAGDFMFVVESGSLECLINDAVVKVVEAGEVFGELALLYNAPRAASVQAKDRCVCWKLDRETFNYIVKDAAVKKRDQYMDFFKQVPLLNAVDSYGRSQVADALIQETFQKGDTVITQGEEGNKFYIIEVGTCEAIKSEGGADKRLELKSGDYFGELALLNNEPRAATVKASSDSVTLLSIDRKAFTRLLGSLKDILTQQQTRYA
jgi:cAMP-dependent protein kinase regulator